jgi:hypothetical protein
MSDQQGFSKENRVRLIYLLDDLMEKPTHYSVGGGYQGGEDFYALDELLRRHLGRLELASYQTGYDAIHEFVLAAPENELLDLIERVPIAKFRGAQQRMGRYEAEFAVVGYFHFETGVNRGILGPCQSVLASAHPT